MSSLDDVPLHAKADGVETIELAERVDDLVPFDGEQPEYRRAHQIERTDPDKAQGPDEKADRRAVEGGTDRNLSYPFLSPTRSRGCWRRISGPRRVRV